MLNVSSCSSICSDIHIICVSKIFLTQHQRMQKMNLIVDDQTLCITRVFAFRDPSQVQVRLGSTYLYLNDSSAQTLTIDMIISNPNYYYYPGPGDIALLRLSSPIVYTDTIRPICLPSSNINLAQFKVCVATGFGLTASSDSSG